MQLITELYTNIFGKPCLKSFLFFYVSFINSSRDKLLLSKKKKKIIENLSINISNVPKFCVQ